MSDVLRLLRLFAPYTRWMAAGILLSTGVILANVALLALAGWFITAMAIAGLGAGTINYFTPAAAIRGLAIIRTVGRYGERLLTHEATLRLLARLRVWFFENLEPLAPARLQYFRGGDLLSRIRADIDTLDNFYLRVIAPTVAAVVGVALMVAFLALYDVGLALIDLAGLVFAGVVLPLIAQRVGRQPGTEAVDRRSALRAGVADTVRGLGELQVYQAMARQTDHLNELSQRLIGPQRRQAAIDAASDALTGLATRLTLWVAVIVAVPLVAQSRLTGPDLAMVAFFVLASFDAVSALPLAYQALGEVRAAARRLFNVVDMPPAVIDPAEDDMTPSRFDLQLTDLRMRYDDAAAWALDGVDLSVAAGERVAVVGATGSGKTSLFNVLLRFWDYQAGGCTIGGRPLAGFRAETVRGWCAVVGQRSHLFNTTIRANLRLAGPDASDAELATALRQACVHDEIMALPDGLDTRVGEAGARVSGGQARRIAIARALLKDAPILLLDEPTEGLDAGSEQTVLQALDGLLSSGKTTLVITHRPQVLAHVERVEVMSQGRIVPKDGSATASEPGYLPSRFAHLV
ncbi:thiol reductant ABC exporter subunit CydC [Salinisphaera orenii]|uniref:thiol reductant ABC exporter subunit CydC n=1 Tax=Salinisphaera orenii TaxID=856731 RepID=UPI000DBE851F